jgi:hypothetical protein
MAVRLILRSKGRMQNGQRLPSLQQSYESDFVTFPAWHNLARDDLYLPFSQYYYLAGCTTFLHLPAPIEHL